MGKQANVNVSEWIEAVKVLDEQLDKAQGTITQKLAEAREACADRVLPFTFEDVVTIDPESGARAIMFSDLSNLAEWAKLTEDEVLGDFMRANKTADTSQVLKDQRTALVDKIKAAVLLGLAKEEDVPANRKGRSGGGSTAGGTKATSKTITYSRKASDEATFTPQGSQDSLSSLAFYYTKGLKADGTLVKNAKGNPDGSIKMGVRDLETYLRKVADVDPYQQAFEVTLANGYTLKAEVVAAGEVTADEAPVQGPPAPDVDHDETTD